MVILLGLVFFQLPLDKNISLYTCLASFADLSTLANVVTTLAAMNNPKAEDDPGNPPTPQPPPPVAVIPSDGQLSNGEVSVGSNSGASTSAAKAFNTMAKMIQSHGESGKVKANKGDI